MGRSCSVRAYGHRAYSAFSRAKIQLDDLSGVKNYVNHDIRRSCRSRWSPIPNISTDVKELALAHTLPGLHKVYNRYDYRDEKRVLLTAWEKILLAIVDPPSQTNVVPIDKPMKIARRPWPKVTGTTTQDNHNEREVRYNRDTVQPQHSCIYT